MKRSKTTRRNHLNPSLPSGNTLRKGEETKVQEICNGRIAK